jgi:hypothetical protein
MEDREESRMRSYLMAAGAWTGGEKYACRQGKIHPPIVPLVFIVHPTLPVQSVAEVSSISD